MPKKSSKEDYEDNEERRWREWGERFGRRVGAAGSGFGRGVSSHFSGKEYDMENSGREGRWEARKERFKDRWEARKEKYKRWGCESGRGWWFWPFGIIGPLFGSIIGIIFILFGVWALDFFNATLHSAFISMLTSAVLNNLQWFLAFSLFVGYASFFARAIPPSRWVLRPAKTGAEFSFAAWILAWVLRAIGIFSGPAALVQVGILLRSNLVLIFLFGAILGFIGLMMRRAFWDSCGGM